MCQQQGGLPPLTFVEEYLGEIHTPWRWFEIQVQSKFITCMKHCTVLSMLLLLLLLPLLMTCEATGLVFIPLPTLRCHMQDAVKKITGDELPDFYNIVLERPKDDPDGYDVLFIDAAAKVRVPRLSVLVAVMVYSGGSSWRNW